MFGFSELLSLIVSAFIILPTVKVLRETGYLLTSWLVGVKNPRLTLGSGPRIIKIGIFDIRRHYHMYSWFSYDSIKRKSKFAYVFMYAGPIFINLIFALTINALLANGLLEDSQTFWERFIFYAFYYVLLDTIPMITINGMPNNGMIIYQMIRHGERTDYNHEPFIPATSDVEEEYEEEMKELQHHKEQVLHKNHS